MLVYPDNSDLERLTFDHTTLQEDARPVNATDYDKRIDALLHQLPETVIATIELCGIRTPGLKPVSTDYVKQRNGVWAHDDEWIKLGNGQWVAKKEDYYRTLTKFDDLEKWQKKAHELVEKQINERKESDLLWFIPYRGQFQEEEVRRTYNEHYDRIFRALVDSTKQEEIVTQMENIRDNAYGFLIGQKYPKTDVEEVLRRIFHKDSEEIYDLVNTKVDPKRIVNTIVSISTEELNDRSRNYA